MKKGFTLLIAIVITSTLLLVSTGIINLALKQGTIANIGKESQHAFYAADTGVECALYWDVNNPSGISAFATMTAPMNITCVGNTVQVGGVPVSIFDLGFSPNPLDPCAEVTVTKYYDVGDVLVTVIESLGYNTCDLTNPRRVERAIRAEY